MKYIALLVLAVGLCVASPAQAGNMKMMADTIKKPMTIKAKKPLLNVVFNHTSHRGINCFTCHHMKDEQKGRYIPCGECHALTGRDTKDPMSMFMAAHTKGSKHSCYSCHTDLTTRAPDTYAKVFYNCRPCHTGLKQAPDTMKAEQSMQK